MSRIHCRLVVRFQTLTPLDMFRSLSGRHEPTAFVVQQGVRALAPLFQSIRQR